MPRRTNDFQELIALIHLQLAPAGAVVTESAIREDALTHHGREVDITIQHELAGYPMLSMDCGSMDSTSPLRTIVRLRSLQRRSA